MLAAEPVWQTGLVVVGGILTLIGLVAGAYFIVKARKGSADDNEATKTVTMMTGQIAALTSAQELAKSENEKLVGEVRHLRSDLATAEKALEDFKKVTAIDIARLEDLNTQQAAVSQFRDEAFAWFAVIAEKVGAAPPLFPDHVAAK